MLLKSLLYLLINGNALKSKRTKFFIKVCKKCKKKKKKWQFCFASGSENVRSFKVNVKEKRRNGGTHWVSSPWNTAPPIKFPAPRAPR
jgi:hypothetical protein